MRRWVVAVVLVLTTTGCARVDRQLFEGLNHSRQTLVSDMPGRVTLVRYRELVTGFSTELLAAQARVQTPGERAILQTYEAAQPGLKDLLAVWEAKDRDDTELLPLRDPLYQRLQREYELPVNTNEPPSIYAGEAMPAIWAATKAKLVAAGTP